MANNSGLAINNDVIARMAEMATLETEGVVAMSRGPVSVGKLLGKKSGTKSVNVSTEHGIIDIELFVKVSDDAKVCDIAEKIQTGVKEKRAVPLLCDSPFSNLKSIKGKQKAYYENSNYRTGTYRRLTRPCFQSVHRAHRYRL